MRPAIPFFVLASIAAVSCTDRRTTTAPPHVTERAAPAASPGASAGIDRDGATSDGGPAAAEIGADAGPDELAPLADLFSLVLQRHDYEEAYRATYDKLPKTPLASLADAAVLCRARVVEPAAQPKSQWDRANGRDLMLETVIDDSPDRRTEGPLGRPAFHVRADEDLRLAAAGKRVRWVLHDRDQQQAYPYVSSIVVGTVDAPADAKVPLRVTKPTFDVECRGAPLAIAAGLLLPEADRALAEAEPKLAWGPSDPRGISQLRHELFDASTRIRTGSVLAQSAGPTALAPWEERVERMRAMLRRYFASARDANARMDPVAVGAWARVGPTLSARVGQWVCPPVPKGADPGSLNPEQREGCGLVVELKSATGLRFDPNPWGPAYACRITSPIDFEAIHGPGRTEGVCVLGFRRGATWLKSSVALAANEPTVAVLAGTAFGQALRIRVGEASALLATPPPPEP